MTVRWTRRGWLATASVAVGGALAADVRKAEEPFRYGLNTATLMGQKLSIVEVVEIASRAGYQALEPWVRELDQYVKDGGSLKDLGKRIADRGLTVDFLGWIAIHGVTEISAILLCGAAGLVIAQKMLFPDRYSRVDSLGMHGRRAAEIAVGAVLMLFVAAILEGGFRQLVASTPGRFAVGAATAIGWLAYIRLVRPAGETQ